MVDATNTAGDNPELEALFDSIAESRSVPPAPAAAPAPAPRPPAGNSAGDSDDLQALFDSVAAEAGGFDIGHQAAAEANEVDVVPAEAIAEDWPGQDRVFNRIGNMMRQLHDTLRELGYDKLLEKTVTAIPDAKDRLAYVANLTEQAACRVLNATDIAMPLQTDMQTTAGNLGERWDRLFSNQLSVEDFKKLASETRSFLKDQVPQKTEATNAQLMEIMMAQDFQDLTGQVIKKIVTLTQELENGLMQALVEVIPDQRRNESVNSLLNGPVISAEGRSDVVVSQQQVDDLLDSLGF